jgi:drug/metabolite transporter (DMT)-like permease
VAVVALGYSVGPFILERYLTDVPDLGVITAALTLTALAYLPVGIAQLPAHWPSAKVIASVLTLAVLCTAIAFLVFFKLIDEVGPVRSTVITYVNPAVAVTLGVILLGEPLTIGISVGFALVIAGSVLATRRSLPAAAPTPARAPTPWPQGLTAPSSFDRGDGTRPGTRWNGGRRAEMYGPDGEIPGHVAQTGDDRRRLRR